MRSKTERTECSPLTITETSDSSTPASARSIEIASRSTKASWAARSRSSEGTASRTAASVRRSRSVRAAKPSGERSVSRSSWPAIPALVAETGSRAAYSSTKASAIASTGRAGCVGHGADPSPGPSPGADRCGLP